MVARRLFNGFVFLGVALLIGIQWDAELGSLTSGFKGLALAAWICVVMGGLHIILAMLEMAGYQPALKPSR